MIPARQVYFAIALIAVVLITVWMWSLWAVQQPFCQATVNVLEDGTWTGGNLVSNQAVIDERWTPERWHFPPKVDGTTCTLKFGGAHD